MLRTPKLKVEMLNTAEPAALRGAVPITADPSSNVTVPVGMFVPACEDVVISDVDWRASYKGIARKSCPERVRGRID